MNTESEDISIFIPVEFEKSETCEKTGKKRMLIKGIASTMSKDSDGEILDPNGFDMSYFIKSGHINWNHQVKNDPSAIIGEPISSEIINNQMVVKGWLYDDSDLAKKVYKLAEVLHKSGSTRRLGFSIEGKVQERSPINKKHITKARITHLAVAPTPKNADAILDIEKGLTNWEFDKAEDGFILDAEFDGERCTVNDLFEINISKAKSKEIDISNIFIDSIMIINKAYEDGELTDEHITEIRSQIGDLCIDINSLGEK